MRELREFAAWVNEDSEFAYRDYDSDPPHAADVPKNLGLIMMYLQKYASQIIGAYKKADRFLYRGTNMIGTTVAIKNPPVDRMPFVITKEVNDFIDKKLRVTGFKALRGNSFFCSSSSEMAGSYGDRYIIFPFNGFSFTWSPKIRDLVMDYDLWADDSQPQRFVNHYYTTTAQEVINELGYKNTDIVSAIISRHEVFIHSKCVFIKADLEVQIRDILGMGAWHRVVDPMEY